MCNELDEVALDGASLTHSLLADGTLLVSWGPPQDWVWVMERAGSSLHHDAHLDALHWLN